MRRWYFYVQKLKTVWGLGIGVDFGESPGVHIAIGPILLVFTKCYGVIEP